MFDIKENLKKLPDEPGVYLHKDKLGQVIYVGKAISLKNRVRQYFQSSKNMEPKVRAMVANIEEFEYIKCGSEMEALILENNLIKKYMPKYNVLLRDDKTYPYIKITSEKWPRVVKTRRFLKDGGKYFGPYSDVGAVNQMVDLLNSIYKLKKCSVKEFPKNARPCLNYHIGQCEAICSGYVNHKNYMMRVEEAATFLRGKQTDLLAYLKNQMMEASDNLQYEEAAKYRDYIIAAKALSEKQRVVLTHTKDIDLIMHGGKGHIILFFVRDGKLSGRETFTLETSIDEKEDSVIGAFIKQHYGQMASGPSEILLRKDIVDRKLLEEFLSACWEKKVTISVPQKGEKKAFLEMAKRDTAEMIKNIDEKEKNKQERVDKIATLINGVVEKSMIDECTSEWINSETGEIITLVDEQSKGAPRVEAYDISNINGVDNVGAMVVFDGLYPNKKAYRRFKIKTVEGPNDYGSMQEVIYRRVKRALDGDLGFLPLPSLMLIDGGKGHIEAVYQVLKKLGVEIAVVGMAKDDSHRTRALVYHPLSRFGNGQFEEEKLKNNSMLFKYIGNIQEEVHRFAIDYHTSMRSKKMTKSVLDDIKGIGPKKRSALLAKFKSVDNIKKATFEELVLTEGITQANAQEIVKFFIDKNNNK